MRLFGPLSYFEELSGYNFSIQKSTLSTPLNESVFLYLHQSNRAVTDLQLYSELSSLPSDLKKEVQDFIEFLKIKAKKQGANKQRKFGGAKGFFKMRADFDEPLEDFKDYM